MEHTIMIPTMMKLRCCAQNCASNLKPSQSADISSPREIGSFFPTRSNTMLIVHMKILYAKYPGERA